jgi:hypothetical protein
LLLRESSLETPKFRASAPLDTTIEIIKMIFYGVLKEIKGR